MLVNPCKIYVYIHNKAVILLLMAIYKNQTTVSQKHTKDFSWLSNEDDDMLSQEHIICQQHLIQESWLSPQPAIWSKSSSCHLNLRKITLNSTFPQILHSSML